MAPPNDSNGSGEADDSSLAALAQDGDEAAFGALMRRWKEPLYRLLRRYVGDPAEAYDVLQETFVTIWTSLASFNSSRPFGPWARRIALNKARDHARRRAVRRFFFTAAPLDEVFVAHPASQGNEDEKLTADQRLDALDRAIANLPYGLKAPLILTVFEGQSQAQAAVLLGLTEKAVELRVARARKALQTQLKDEG
jgi:RNA polymerase sigma factor (sigma-70 family)